MGLIISTKKEIEWIESERRLQKFNFSLTVISFLLMIYAFFKCLVPNNILTPIYNMTFLFSFLAFMVTTLVLTKSQRYLQIIDMLLKERRQ